MYPFAFDTKAMGIKFQCFCLADKKGHSQRWLKKYWSDNVDHIFKENQSVINRSGPCVLHPRQNCRLCEERPNLVLDCFPCQGYSKKRFKKTPVPGFARTHRTSKQGLAHQHPGHYTASDEFYDYLQEHRPDGFIVEETDAWAHTKPDGGSFCAPGAPTSATQCWRLMRITAFGQNSPGAGPFFPTSIISLGEAMFSFHMGLGTVLQRHSVADSMRHCDPGLLPPLPPTLHKGGPGGPSQEGGDEAPPPSSEVVSRPSGPPRPPT